MEVWMTFRKTAEDKSKGKAISNIKVQTPHERLQEAERDKMLDVLLKSPTDIWHPSGSL